MAETRDDYLAVDTLAVDREQIERLCMANLLAEAEERVYFKDEKSRFLVVSEGYVRSAAPGQTSESLIGQTDFDIFSDEHASAAFADEQHIMRTGHAIVGKVERETYADRPDAWVSTTKMPLRDTDGRIVGTFGISRDITAQVNAEKALAFQALHDAVTGLVNRTALMDRISQGLAALDRRREQLAVFFIDLDNFKDINDSFGHDAGDRVLAEIGRRITRVARRSDTVARLGGDEFVILCGSLHASDDARLLADRIVQAIGAPIEADGEIFHVRASLGIAIASDGLVEADEIVREADMAMYAAKRAGGNRYRLADGEQRHRARTNHVLELELRRALEHRELFVCYQPLRNLDKDTLSGVEALVRWRHPDRGIVPPDEFIPFAEDHGLITQIDTFVLDEACRQLAEWRGTPGIPPGFTLSVNVSGRQLVDRELPRRVARALARHQIDPPHLCLEITETALIGEVCDAEETLAALSALGVRLALDDFGTGYSTLAHLRRLRVDVLKIDRSFVEQIGRSPRDREIVAAVTAMSHALGMTVVGEGIETSLQRDALADLACDEGQGFLFARALPPADIAELLAGEPA